jgi:hypothetical protein
VGIVAEHCILAFSIRMSPVKRRIAVAARSHRPIPVRPGLGGSFLLSASAASTTRGGERLLKARPLPIVFLLFCPPHLSQHHSPFVHFTSALHSSRKFSASTKTPSCVVADHPSQLIVVCSIAHNINTLDNVVIMATAFFSTDNTFMHMLEQAKQHFLQRNAHLPEQQQQQLWLQAASVLPNQSFNLDASSSLDNSIPRSMSTYSMSSITQTPVCTAL